MLVMFGVSWPLLVWAILLWVHYQRLDAAEPAADTGLGFGLWAHYVVGFGLYSTYLLGFMVGYFVRWFGCRSCANDADMDAKKVLSF